MNTLLATFLSGARNSAAIGQWSVAMQSPGC
jgi:hypothetical protein